MKLKKYIYFHKLFKIKKILIIKKIDQILRKKKSEGFSENLEVNHKNQGEEGKKKESMRAKLETSRLHAPPRHGGATKTLRLPPQN